jgi:hypothetical protein
MLGGHSSTLYDDQDDLMAVKESEPPDRLTAFVRNNFAYLFRVNSTLTLIPPLESLGFRADI